MDGWMEVGMDGWIDGRTDGRTDGPYFKRPFRLRLKVHQA